MAYETVSGGVSTGEKPNTIYYTYKMPEDGELKEGIKLLKKDSSVEGYYLNSYVSPKSKYKTQNHVLVDEANTHHVIPGATDIDRAFGGEKVEKAVKTKFTYLGKVPFNTKDGGTAMARKCLLEQDKEVRVEFDGDQYNAKISTGKSTGDSVQTTEDIPF